MTTYFSRDTVEVSFDDTGISNDGEDFSLDEDKVVSVKNAPWQTAFDTDKFLSVSATVARPIKQEYRVGEDTVKVFKKPREELKKAAWSLDNSPFTVSHPESGRVKNVNDVSGFWRDPTYNEDEDNLDANLYIPVNDDEALEFVQENDNVSVGFSHGLRASDEDGVDAYQVDIYFDHVAGVEKGRCDDEDGCGLDRNVTDVETDNSMDIEYDITPYNIFVDDDGETGVLVENDYRDEDDNYFAVSPEEGMGEPKYPIANCSDVEDAWKLRGHGDYRISQETLVERIKRRAEDLDCDEMPWSDESSDSSALSQSGETRYAKEDNENNSNDKTMTNDNCDCTDDGSDDDGGVSFDASSFSIDYLREKNDAVDELYEEKQELEQKVDEKDNKIDELREEVDEYREKEKESIVDSITDITDTWDEDELMEQSLDELGDRLELAKDATESVGTANSTSSTDDSPEKGRVGGTVDPLDKHTV